MPQQPIVIPELDSSGVHPSTTSQSKGPTTPAESLDEAFSSGMSRMLHATRDERDLEQLAEDLQRATDLITRGLQNGDSPYEIREAFDLWFEIGRLVSSEPAEPEPVVSAPEPAAVVVATVVTA